MRRNWRNWFSLLVVVAVSGALSIAEDKPLPDIQTLTAKSPLPPLEQIAPIRLSARFTVNNKRSTHQGRYVFAASNANEYRREFVVGDYREVHTYKNGRLYIERPQREAVPALFRIANDVVFGRPADLVHFRPGENVKHRKIRGGEAACIEFTAKNDGRKREACYLLPAAIPLTTAAGGVQYGEHREFAGTVLPRRIKMSDGWVELEIEDVQRDTVVALTAPSAAQHVFETCAVPNVPVLRKRVAPEYPTEARARRMQGPTYLWAIVAADGKLRDLTIVGDKNPLSEAAFAAVRQWEYHPARCGDRPVETEIVVNVNFTLSPY